MTSLPAKMLFKNLHHLHNEDCLSYPGTIGPQGVTQPSALFSLLPWSPMLMLLPLRAFLTQLCLLLEALWSFLLDVVLSQY